MNGDQEPSSDTTESLEAITNAPPIVLRDAQRNVTGDHHATYLSASRVHAGPFAGLSLADIGISAGEAEGQDKCTCELIAYIPEWARLDGGTGKKKLDGTEQQGEARLYSTTVGGCILFDFILGGLKEPADGKYRIYGPKGESGLEFYAGHAYSNPDPTKSQVWLNDNEKCPGKVEFTIRAVKEGRFRVTADWNETLVCQADILVRSTDTSAEPLLETEKAKQDYDKAKKARDDAKAKADADDLANAKCNLNFSLKSQRWINTNYEEPVPLDDKYNKKGPAKGKTSWNANWPGLPIWEAIVTAKRYPDIGEFTWTTECSVIGHMLDKDGEMTKGAHKGLSEAIKTDEEFKKAWRNWLDSQECIEDSDVEKKLESIKQEPANGKGMIEDEGAVIVELCSGKLPCIPGEYIFHVPVLPIPASIDSKGKPAVHRVFYVCRLYIDGALVADSGVKMLVVKEKLDDPKEVGGSKGK